MTVRNERKSAMFKKTLKASILTILLMLSHSNAGNAHRYRVYNDSDETIRVHWTFEFAEIPKHYKVTIDPHENINYSTAMCASAFEVCISGTKICKKDHYDEGPACNNVNYELTYDEENEKIKLKRKMIIKD